MPSANISRIVERAAAKFSAHSGSSGMPFSQEIKQLRHRLGLTQEAFCQRYMIPIANLRNWEQAGRNVEPDTAGRLLVEMIKVDPEKVADLVRLTRVVREERETA